MTLWLALLLACGTPSPTPAELEAAPVAAPAPALPRPVRAPGADDVVLYEVLLAHPTEAVSGVRVWSNGAVEEPVGTPSAPRWTATRMLAPEDLDIVRRLLATPEVAAVPAVLPVIAPTDRSPTRGLWRMRVGDAERHVRTDSQDGVRVPVLDRIETVIRGGNQTFVHARWTLSLADLQGRHAMPCDPTQAAATRGVATALLDHDLAPAAPSEAPELLRIDWFAWPTSWQALLRTDGTVTRTDWEGRVTTWKLPSDGLPPIDGALHRLPWDDLRSVCAP